MNKNLITVVTAHQLTADTIATAIGANEKHDGYFLGNGYAVTWTNGGVIEAKFKPSERFILNSGMDPTTSSLSCATMTHSWVTTRVNRTLNSSPQSRLSGK